MKDAAVCKQNMYGCGNNNSCCNVQLPNDLSLNDRLNSDNCFQNISNSKSIFSSILLFQCSFPMHLFIAQAAITSSAVNEVNQRQTVQLLDFACDYPGCLKRFAFNASLWRHQVKKHGRIKHPYGPRPHRTNDAAS